MSRLIHPLPFEPRASGRAPKRKDTSATCRERATADLLESVTMITSNKRLTLEGSAVNWELHAPLLDRVEETAEARVKAATKGLSA